MQLQLKPWAFIGGQARSARPAGLIAAAEQNKGFDYAEVLYDNQGTEDTGWLNDQMIAHIAASVTGLKPYQLAQRRQLLRG